MAEQETSIPPDRDPTDTEFEQLLRRAARAPAMPPSKGYFASGRALQGGRFHVLRRVGEGGMGVVYEAYDEHRRSTVALKTLNAIAEDGVYRLKREFRSLAEVTHPHLCHLHELFVEAREHEGDGECFFTMELIAGERFDRWVRPEGVLVESRLRAALPQLVEAIAVIHEAGKLHRDLKPSNVLVTEEGRVVVLDFGLAVDRTATSGHETQQDERVSGTPAYMAPEQAAGAGAVPASDFYSLGVLLFEALTGRLPFEGRVGEVLAAKQRDAAPSVHSLAPNAPADLAALCDALLARAPERRTDATALRATLGSHEPKSARVVRGFRRESLLGREHELAELRSAFDTMRGHRAVATFVAGESGMGKTALVEEFLGELRAQGHAVVLAGRCYERESVPFKAFDSVVDDLSRHLRRLARDEAFALMPREVFALARLFPVLERVGAVAESPKKEIPDPQELQERAFAAFAELFGRLRDRRPVVIYIDDLQWACRDSCVFLEYLFAQPEPTPLLLIVSHRSEGAADNALLGRILAAAKKNARVDCRELGVDRLPEAAARSLAERMLGDDGPSASVSGIVEEAQGSPFFLGELVRHARVVGTEPGTLTLQEALRQHVQSLRAETRALLDVLAVAGRPLTVQLALDASGARHEAIDQLLAERLSRAGGSSSTERTLECYHDKVREYVASALDGEPLRSVHRRLAEHLAAHDAAAPEHLALHHHGAGQHREAVVHYERAGDVAVAALAFDYAARQYEQALSLVDEGPSKRALRVKLGAALASAGSSREAAEVYRTAALDAPPELAREYLCAAANLLTTSGYLDEGRLLADELLGTIGLALPRSQGGAIAAALFARSRLWFRGLALSPSATGPTPETERTLAALWTVVQGAVGNDPFVMVDMAARYTRLALDTGARAHAARALSLEAYLGSFEGPPTRARSERILADGRTLADAIGQPELLGWVKEMHGCVLVHEGRFAEARPVLGDAIEWLQSSCKHVPFELACGRGYDLNSANHLGDFADIAEAAWSIVENSLRRGDMYQACGVTGFALPSWVAHHGLDHGKSRFEDAKRFFKPQKQFQWADYLMLMAEVSLVMFEGDPRRAHTLLVSMWPVLVRSQLMRMEIAHVMMQYLRAGCALAAERQGQGRADMGHVREGLRVLKKSPLSYAPGWAGLLEASLALRDGDTGRAAERLKTSLPILKANGFKMYAAGAERRLGQLLGGEEGAAHLAASERAMAAQGVIDLEATTEMLVPGCRT